MKVLKLNAEDRDALRYLTKRINEASEESFLQSRLSRELEDQRQKFVEGIVKLQITEPFIIHGPTDDGEYIIISQEYKREIPPPPAPPEPDILRKGG